MTAASTQTLFGFDSDLDWRPTRFVTPFPWTSVCSVCGLVPSTVATLPCRHFLCQPCFERSVSRYGLCPVDMQPLRGEDVAWSTVSRDSVLVRNVHCWNVENGCTVEDTASAVLKHFTNGCEFHVVICPRCGDKVPHRDIPGHLQSTSGTPCRRQQPLGDSAEEMEEALGRTLEGMRESDENIKIIVHEEFDRRMEAFRAIFPVATSTGPNGVDTAFVLSGGLAMKHRFKKTGEQRPMELLAAASLCIQSDVLGLSLPFVWEICDWTEFRGKKDSSRDYVSCVQDEARYHFGFLMMLELCLSAPSDLIWFRVHVIKGLFDRFLLWPMNKQLKVCFYDFSEQEFVHFTSGFEWMPQPETVPGVTKEVVYTGYSRTMSLEKRTFDSLESGNRFTMALQFVSSLE